MQQKFGSCDITELPGDHEFCARERANGCVGYMSMFCCRNLKKSWGETSPNTTFRKESQVVSCEYLQVMNNCLSSCTMESQIHLEIVSRYLKQKLFPSLSQNTNMLVDIQGLKRCQISNSNVFVLLDFALKYWKRVSFWTQNSTTRQILNQVFHNGSDFESSSLQSVRFWINLLFKKSDLGKTLQWKNHVSESFYTVENDKLCNWCAF